MPARNNVSAPAAHNITDVNGVNAAGVATAPPVSGADTGLQVYANLGSEVVAVSQELQGAANFATGQAAVSTVTPLLAARPTRRSAIVSNPSTSTAIYVGGASVSATTGQIIPSGNSLTIPFTGAIYAVAATGTITVTFAEAYD
jgi:hypothetical protein